MTEEPFTKPYLAELGDEGNKYVRECLEQSEAFSKLVLSKVDLSKGTVYLVVSNEQIQDAYTHHRPLNQHAVNNPTKDEPNPTQLLLDKLRQLDKELGPLALIGEDNGIEFRDKGKHFIPDQPYYMFSEKLWLYAENISDIKEWHSIDVMGLTIGFAENTYIIAIKDLVGNPGQDHNLSGENASKLAASVIGIISGAYHAYASDTYTLWLRNTEMNIAK